MRGQRAGRVAVGADSLSPAPVCGRPALGRVLLPREVPALVEKLQGYAVLFLSQVWGGEEQKEAYSPGFVDPLSPQIFSPGAPDLLQLWDSPIARGGAFCLDTTNRTVSGFRPSGTWQVSAAGFP